MSSGHTPPIGIFRRHKWRTGSESDLRHYFCRTEKDEATGQVYYVSACGVRLEYLGGHRMRRPPLADRCEACNRAEMALRGLVTPMPADKGWDRPD